jgi:GT2 family glycosyltransferase
MLVSVIIPHYNRPDPLRETIVSLGEQTLSHIEFEVIVVDDGSDPDIVNAINSLDLPGDFRVLLQNNIGAAAARNLGAREAQGKFLLFLDSDMIAERDLLEQHILSHQRYQRALIVGNRLERVDQVSPWLSKSDGYPITDPRIKKGTYTFQEAFTCNLSIRSCHWRSLGGFDEQFPRSGFEDVEFAYRAKLEGFEIVSNLKALAYHNHPMSMQQRCLQERNYQGSAALLFKKHPELWGTIAHLKDKEPLDLHHDTLYLIARKVTRQILALTPILGLMAGSYRFLERYHASPRLLRFLFWKIIGSYQLIGFREGLQRYKVSRS